MQQARVFEGYAIEDFGELDRGDVWMIRPTDPRADARFDRRWAGDVRSEFRRACARMRKCDTNTRRG